MKDLNCKKTNVDVAITLLHVIGMVMIFLCHALQLEKIYFLSEIFISGVPLFLFVSGYLAGRRKIDNVGKWYLGKAKRVLIPALVFIVVVYSTYEITGIESVSSFQWIFSLCNLQGLNYTYWKFNSFWALPGCGHLWFVTSLMFCYLLTPLLQKCKKISLKGWQSALLIVAVLACQLGLMYAGLQLSYIVTFFFGYFLAGKEIRTDSLWFGFVTLLTVLLCGTRLVLKNVLDGSDFYDRYFALVSSAFIAAWIFYAVYFLKAKAPKLFGLINGPVLLFTGRISYYFYLTHYLFLRSPFAVFGYIPNRLLAHVLAFVFSYVSGAAMYFAIEKGLFKIFERRKENK